MRRTITWGLLVAIEMGAPVCGQPPAEADAASAGERGAPSATGGAGWRFELAPYVWAVSLDGDAAVQGNGFDVDAPFTDTLDDSDTLIGLMGHVEVGRGRWSLFFDPAFSMVGYDDVPTQSGDADVAMTMAWFEFGGAWRVLGDEPGRGGARVDAIAGARLTSLELDVDLDGGGGARGDQTWVEPFIGARTQIDLGERFMLRVRGDVGGFGAGSDFAWQAIGTVGWNVDLFGLDSTLFAGYRELGQDYEDDGFEWNVIAHGPILGLGFTF